ncbi:hypothetical protein PG989_013014 [Apiospora arundinis]
MPLQEGLQPHEDVASDLGVNGHSTSRPYGNGYSIGNNQRDDSITPVVSDITTSIIPNSQPSAHHVLHPSPRKESQFSIIINSSPAPSSRRQTLFSSPAARSRDELSLEIKLPTRLQPRKAHGSPAAGAAMSNSMSHEGEDATPQPRKRGRPKGWKPGTPYNPNKGVPSSASHKTTRKPKSASTASNQEPRRRGRPPKPPDLTIRQWYLQSDPKYMSFDCEWHDMNPKGELTRCPAELQNMDTLRKHVLLMHCSTEPPLVCRWGKCGSNELFKTPALGEGATTNENGAEHQHQPQEFVDEGALRAHVEKEHMEPFVWHMGDGPQNKGIWTLKQDPNKQPQYLFGEDGNQVTPSIKGQQFEDTQGMMERKRRLRAIQRQAMENAPDESEFFLQAPETDA